MLYQAPPPLLACFISTVATNASVTGGTMTIRASTNNSGGLTSWIIQRWRAAINSFQIGSESSSIDLLESSGTHSRAGTRMHHVVFCVKALTLYYPRTRPQVISAIILRILAEARRWCME